MSRIRKHLRDKLFNSLPEPTEDQVIVNVVGHRGSNQIEVEFPTSCEKILVMIPQKFKKMIWIKRGDYLIVKYDRSDQNIGKIKGIVEYLLQPNQIRNLKKKKMWPKKFWEEEQKRGLVIKDEEKKKKKEEKDGNEIEEENSGESESDDDSGGFNKNSNPNVQYYSDDESDESSDED